MQLERQLPEAMYCLNASIMTQKWIKFVYERNTYVVNLNCISNFACAQNGHLRFWLPDAKVWVIIHPRTNSEAYLQILDYVEKMTGKSLYPNFKNK